MPDAEELRALIERVKAASGPDRQLDEAIALWRRPDLTHAPYSPSLGGWLTEKGGVAARPYTSSLDAAAILVPPGHSWYLSVRPDVGSGARTYYRGHSHEIATEVSGATPALALCAAALQAQLEEAEPRDA